MTLQEELYELQTIKGQIETAIFQKYIVKPIKDELDKLKNAYDCDSLRELQTLKGKKQGLMKLMEVLKAIDNDYKNKLYESNNSRK